MLLSHAFIVVLGNTELYISDKESAFETSDQPYISLANISDFAVFDIDAYWDRIREVRAFNYPNRAI